MRRQPRLLTPNFPSATAVVLFMLPSYSGFQAAVYTPEGKIFRFVRQVAKIFR